MSAFRSRFGGVCNQCGRCCQFEAPHGAGLVRCGYLILEDTALDLVGTPGATECALYALRTDGMPIPMHVVATGDFYGWRACAKDSAQEDAVIAPHVGHGCSLTAVA